MRHADRGRSLCKRFAFGTDVPEITTVNPSPGYMYYLAIMALQKDLRTDIKSLMDFVLPADDVEVRGGAQYVVPNAS